MYTPPATGTTGPSNETAQSVARQALQAHDGQKGALLPILHAIQDELGCIPKDAVPVLVEALQLSRAEIHGVISFYPHFREKAAGPLLLEVCRAESCQAMGADALAEHVAHRLHCGFHETTPNGQLTLEPVYCLGLCAQSPAVMLNGQPHARMTPSKLDRLLDSKGCTA